MALTTDQLNVINDDGDMLVSASAGAGKTTVMLHRVIRHLQHTPLSRMLISTFTKSAAADMREKLNRLLREEYASTGNESIRAQYESLPTADICTLHTWCAKIVRKYFYITGDDPSFEIAGEEEARMWKKEAIIDAVESEMDNPDYVNIYETYTNRRKQRKIYDIVDRLIEYSRAQDGGEGWLDGAADGYGKADAALYLDEYDSALMQEFTLKYNEFEAYAKQMDLWDKASEHAAALLPILNDPEYRPEKQARGITAIKAEYDELREIAMEIGTLRKSRTECNSADAQRAANMFILLAKKAGQAFAEKKIEKGVFDFSDLEIKAKQILLSDAGDEIRASYDYIFIDEYQDINPLQESIIKMLSGKAEMFYVGDIKQSIYAFRNCTPTAFNSKSHQLPPDSVRRLNANFRSRKDILEFCNSVFSRTMTENFGMVNYARDAKFVAGRTDESEARAVEIIGFKPSDRSGSFTEDFSSVYSVAGGDKKEIKESEEALAIASKIVQLLGERMTINGEMRDIGYDDIVVLYRSGGGCLDELVRTLMRIGIPVTYGRSVDITGEVHNKCLISYLRLIDNSRDDVAMIGTMRSYFGKFTDKELAVVRKIDLDAPFFECVERYASEKSALGEKVKAFLTRTDELRNQSGVLDAGELAGKITAEFDYFKYILGKSGGSAQSEALSSLLEKMTAFSGDLSDWLKYIDELDVKEKYAEADGSVRLMSVHASKGLEFPIVIMCNLGKPFNNRDICDGMCDSRFGLALQSKSLGERKTYNTEVYLATRISKTLANKEEELRILYVAMTRAREKLIVLLPEVKTQPPTAPHRAGNMASWLRPSAEVWGVRDYQPIDFQPRVQSGSEVSPEILGQLKAGIVQFDIQPAKVKSTVTAIIHQDPFSYDYDSGDVIYSDYDRGNDYHKVMELYDYSKPTAQITDLIACREVKAEDIEWATEELSKIIDGGTVYREQPFLFKTDDGIVQGIIDMLIMRDGECDIVDYKTGKVTQSKLETYTQQLCIYANAVQSVLGVRVNRKIICALDDKQMFDV